MDRDRSRPVDSGTAVTEAKRGAEKTGSSPKPPACARRSANPEAARLDTSREDTFGRAQNLADYIARLKNFKSQIGDA